MSHSQVQSLISAIGSTKGYDVWVPQNNRSKLDTNLLGEFQYREELPSHLSGVSEILQEIDVVWFRRGSNQLCGLFEVEHTTPIYSALLRFNDIHLEAPSPNQTFRIIADEKRRALFVRQLNRPTFRASGLNQICTFLEYRNVYGWFKRICRLNHNW
jgi:type II restriction enzyme